MRRALFFSLLLATATTPLAAAPQDYAAAVAAKGRPADQVALDTGRKPAEVLDFLGLKTGMTALDFIAGGGYYTEIMGQAVGPKGVVIAYQPTPLHDDKSKAAYAELIAHTPNVKVMTVGAEALGAAPTGYDFVMIHLNYHDLYYENAARGIPRSDPDQVLAGMFRAVKPGGIVGVIDHAGEPGDTRAIVDKLHRIDPATVKVDFVRAGFVLEAESDLLRNPADDKSKLVFDPAVRGKTDRFVYRFRKPA